MNLLFIAVAIGLAAVGFQELRVSWEKTAHAESRLAHERDRADWQRESRVAVEAARTEEQRRTAAVQGVVDETQSVLDAALLESGKHALAAQRLRDRVSAIAASSCPAPSGSSAASTSAPADPTADLRAVVQRRLDEAADGIAGFADSAHARGRACERIFDAVRGG